jgi:ABC-type multidrug transport system ATPase subunit
MTLLRLHDLSFHYPERQLIDHLSLDIPAGVTIVRGGDGRGKTSLLRLIAGVEQAQGGYLSLNELRPDQEGERYRQQVYYVDPRTDAFDRLSVPEYFASVRQRFAGFDETALPDLIEGLSLTAHLEKKLFMLSTGSKRKVYLAAAFAAGAPLTLLDDPFAGLDHGSIHFVCQTLNALSARADTQQVWVASFYEVPQQITAVAQVDLGE